MTKLDQSGQFINQSLSFLRLF